MNKKTVLRLAESIKRQILGHLGITRCPKDYSAQTSSILALAFMKYGLSGILMGFSMKSFNNVTKQIFTKEFIEYYTEILETQAKQKKIKR